MSFQKISLEFALQVITGIEGSVNLLIHSMLLRIIAMERIFFHIHQRRY